MATASTTLSMAEQLVPDEIWAAIQPLLPPKPPHPKGGRPWIEERGVGGTDWRESGRPGQGWLQIPPADRQQRPAAGGWAVGGQHPRLPAAPTHGGCRAGGHPTPGAGPGAAGGAHPNPFPE